MGEKAATPEKETCAADFQLFDFRLREIEKSIADLKDVVLETKMQERDIKDLTSSMNELLKAVNSHDGRIKELEMRPTREKADRWQFIIEYLFKSIVIGLIVYFLSKFNFPIAN